MIQTYAERAQSDVRMEVSMTVNGSLRTLKVEPRTTLLDALRDELGLTGPKKSCDRGECGACTVHIDGRRILSCVTLAAMHNGQRITTIEGLESNGSLHAVQEMFIEHDGFQCGFCTSGQIMSAVTVIAITESALPITDEFLMIVADRLTSHLKVRIDEILATRLLDARSGRT
jgi:aerobic-type carbon monoxide dehydrogenase small subunit (CoxS/CutS family)